MIQELKQVAYCLASGSEGWQLAAIQKAVAQVQKYSSAATCTAPITDQDRIFQNIYGVHDTSIKVLCCIAPEEQLQL